MVMASTSHMWAGHTEHGLMSMTKARVCMTSTICEIITSGMGTGRSTIQQKLKQPGSTVLPNAPSLVSTTLPQFGLNALILYHVDSVVQ